MHWRFVITLHGFINWQATIGNQARRIFFLAHAVRARGSDGHTNVCGRSTILKLWEQVKMQKTGCPLPEQKDSRQHKETNKTPPRNKEDIQ